MIKTRIRFEDKGQDLLWMLVEDDEIKDSNLLQWFYVGKKVVRTPKVGEPLTVMFRSKIPPHDIEYGDTKGVISRIEEVTT